MISKLKKLLAAGLSTCLFLSSAQATVITRPNTYTAGNVIDPTAVTQNETTIYNDYNGSINNTNIAANGVAFSNLAAAIQTIWAYRRPVLVYNSGTVVNIETGVNGSAGYVQIVFPDGTARTDNTAGRIQINLAQVAALTGTAQSGLRTGSQTANTWYACYAVKSQVNTTDLVGVCDTTLPLQANYSNLNSYFGTNGWVYLGMIANGDNSGSTNVILKFSQSGNTTYFRNITAGNVTNMTGPLLGKQSVAGATLTFTYAAGTNIATPQIPNQISNVVIEVDSDNTALEQLAVLEAAGNIRHAVLQSPSAGAVFAFKVPMCILDGAQAVGAGANKHDMALVAFTDNALGVGLNPQL